MTRHVVSVALLWAVLTAIGEGSVFLDLFPAVGSSEAEDFDRIFRILLIMGTPVFAFVIAVLAYSMVTFRASGPDDAPPAFRGEGKVPKVWLVITGALALTVMIYPGLTGLRKLQSDPNGYGWSDTQPNLFIHVQAFQWGWQFDYRDFEGQPLDFSVLSVGGNAAELVLPIDVGVKFDINATQAPYDPGTNPEGGVLHSFWIPAFRMKIDAVPGRTTTMTVKPIELRGFQDDSAFRVQCAELCGLGHAVMATPVRVVDRAAFLDWVALQKAAARK
jgi:cytochrome c oxidase subunit 2